MDGGENTQIFVKISQHNSVYVFINTFSLKIELNFQSVLLKT